MMYLILGITGLVVLSTLLLQAKIKRQAKTIDNLQAEKKMLEVQAEIDKTNSEIRQASIKNQATIDKTTEEIKEKIPESTQELSNEEKNVVNDITSNFND